MHLMKHPTFLVALLNFSILGVIAGVVVVTGNALALLGILLLQPMPVVEGDFVQQEADEPEAWANGSSAGFLGELKESQN